MAAHQMYLRSHARNLIQAHSYARHTTVVDQRRRFLQEVLQSADPLHMWLDKYFKQAQGPLLHPDNETTDYVLCTLELEREKVSQQN